MAGLGGCGFEYEKSEITLLFNNPSYHKIIALFDDSHVPAVSSSYRSSVTMKMSKDHCWNITNREESTYSEKIVPVPLCLLQISDGYE